MGPLGGHILSNPLLEAGSVLSKPSPDKRLLKLNLKLHKTHYSETPLAP